MSVDYCNGYSSCHYGVTVYLRTRFRIRIIVYSDNQVYDIHKSSFKLCKLQV